MDREEALDFASTSIGLTQYRSEISWLYDLVADLAPRVVVEIGLARGGTFFLWTRAAADDALLVAIDSVPLSPLGRWGRFARSRRAFARDRQRVKLLMGSDSHDPNTVDALRRALGDRPIDFLFIDGDHSYEGVKQDFEVYGALVRAGGLVALHDVNPAPDERRRQPVADFWAELQTQRRTEQRIDHPDSGYGIGIVRY